MTLLTIAQTVAKNASIEPPDTVQSDDDDALKLVQFINEAGQECARRVDWSVLRKITTITGTGFDAMYPLPTDYDRLVRGMNMRITGGAAVRGGLSAEEWFSLDNVAGTPRFYRIAAKQVGFFPYPDEGLGIKIQYISGNWVSGDKALLANDTDTALIDEKLIAKGATWRIRRHIGADFSDQLAEFEAILADLAKADGAERIP